MADAQPMPNFLKATVTPTQYRVSANQQAKVVRVVFIVPAGEVEVLLEAGPACKELIENMTAAELRAGSGIVVEKSLKGITGNGRG